MDVSDTIKELHVEVKRCPDCGARFGLDATFCPFCGVALVAASWDPSRDVLIGKIVDNRYEVHEPLGEGGMGTVYKARHVTLDRMFAMKVLRRDLANDPGLAQRFVQEARATAAIKHPGVVAINDFGSLDDGIPYFVMELLSGETLSVRMRARGLMAPKEVIAIATKIALALQAAHDANVVHRDLKPENVFLVGRMSGKSAEDEIRIVDFGAAKVIGGSKLTRPGVVFGTPYYMSPEQAGGSAVDARADIYSLGVLMYEMLTGAVPFEADTYMGVLTKHMFAEPTKPSARVPAGVQLGELEGVVLRALEKEPSQRFASMSELAAALQVAGKARSSSRPAKTAPPKNTDSQKLSTAERIELSVTKAVLEEERRKRRQTIVITAVGVAAAISLGAAAITVIATTEKETRPTPRMAVQPEPPPKPTVTATTPPPIASETAPVVTAPPPAPTPTPPPVIAAPVAKPRPKAPPSPSPPPPATTPARPKGPDDFQDPWMKGQ